LIGSLEFEETLLSRSVDVLWLGQIREPGGGGVGGRARDANGGGVGTVSVGESQVSGFAGGISTGFLPQVTKDPFNGKPLSYQNFPGY